MAQTVKRLFTVWETRVRALGREDPLEKEMATHSSTIAWKIPWTEEPGRLQSMGSQRVGHDWATSLCFKRAFLSPICFQAHSQPTNTICNVVCLNLWTFTTWRFICRRLAVYQLNYPGDFGNNISPYCLSHFSCITYAWKVPDCQHAKAPHRVTWLNYGKSDTQIISNNSQNPL